MPLAQRIKQTEALARQRGVDLANLSELNEYIVQHLRESIVVDRPTEHVIRLINASAATVCWRHRSKSDSANRSGARGAGELADYVRRRVASGPSRSVAPRTSNCMRKTRDRRITAHLAPLGKGDERREGPVLIFLEDASLLNARVCSNPNSPRWAGCRASIAHEIRNPVGAMSHAGQLLAESEALGRATTCGSRRLFARTRKGSATLSTTCCNCRGENRAAGVARAETLAR